jgi:hypothetical protein
VILLLFAGCFDVPASNEPPRLVSVNDAVYDYQIGGYSIQGSAGLAEPGTDLEIEVVYDDPEGQHVRIWWPAAPEGFEFDPDGTTGVWHVPEEVGAFPGEWEILLEDTGRDPAVTSFWVPVTLSWGMDTGG